MNKFITKLAVLAIGAASILGVGDNGAVKASAEDAASEITYEKLTAIADIDTSAKYVLGNEERGYHYEGTSKWGRVASPTTKTVFNYTLTPKNEGFTACIDVEGTIYYLPSATSNFTMSTAEVVSGLKEGGIVTSSPGSTYAFVYNHNSGAGGIRVYNNGDTDTNSSGALKFEKIYFYKVNDPSEGASDETKAKNFMIEVNKLYALGENITSEDDLATINAKIVKIESDYEGLTDEVKAYVDNTDDVENYNYAHKIAAIKDWYNAAVANDLWTRMDTLDTGTVATTDEETIDNFKVEYANLNASQKDKINAKGYEAKIASLESKLLRAFIDPVEEMITALPAADEITTEANWIQYNEAVSKAKTAFDSLSTDRQNAVQTTLKEKLLAVVAAMEKVAPVATKSTHEFSATNNSNLVYPEGWTGTLEGLFNVSTSFKAVGEYAEIANFLTFDAKKITALSVTVYSITNGTTNTDNELTVYGLNDGQKINDCSDVIVPNSGSNTAGNVIENSNNSPKTVYLSSETLIEGIRIEMTRRQSNVVISKVEISYVITERGYSAEFDALVADITAAETCSDYEQATAFRTRYNALIAEERAVFDNTRIEAENVTCGAKLAYMEAMLEKADKAKGGSGTASVINDPKEETPITLIVLIAVLGLSVVSAYYFINKRKQQA